MSRRGALRLVFGLQILASATLAGQERWSPGDCEVLISEIHYHPAEKESEQEFVELHNAGVRWVDVSGWTLGPDVELAFPAGSVIAPGGFLVAARNASVLRASAKISNLIGDFKGSLSNTGGILELRNRAGWAIGAVHYLDGGGVEGGMWPARADGAGPSLELIEPHPDWRRSWCWGASRVPGGTPGRENSRSRSRAGEERRKLRINEARLDEAGGFVEVFNEGEASVNLEAHRLTTHPRGEGGIPLSGTLAKRKFHVVEGEAVKALAGGSSMLYLMDGRTGDLLDSAPIRANVPAAGSFGRFPDGSGDVFTTARATPGVTNGARAAADLVINEILYHGKGEKQEDEFIELHNRGKSAVPLKDWMIDRAAQFTFPDGAVLAAGGFAVVAADPDKLKSRLGPAEAQNVFGPLKGKLSDGGETLVLANASGDVIDRVRYGDNVPWPKGADRGGTSLELLHPDLDNRWAQTWTVGAGGGTPGKKNAALLKAMAPVIARVRHEPAVPAPEEGVIVHAYVLDTGSLSEVAVVYRNLSARAGPAKKTMSDNGQIDDGLAKDGHYAARLPKFPAGSLVAFSIIGRDSAGNATRFPAGDRDCHFLVEVPSKTAAGSIQPVYRVLMAYDLWDRFQRSSPFQDNLHPCTFIASVAGRGADDRDGQAFYGASIRYRGNSSRIAPDGRRSYRLVLADGDTFDGRDRLVLSAYNPLLQKVAGDALAMIGLPTPSTNVVRFKTPGFDENRYADLEVVGGEFLDREFGSSAVDIFRGRRVMGRGGVSADLSYHGPDPAQYANAYERSGKKDHGGMKALIAMLEALNTADDARYAQSVEKVIDPAEWAAYFAGNHVVLNEENGLAKGVADDYYVCQRPTDGKFILVPWDQNEALLFKQFQATQPLFGPSLPAIRRFLQHPAFAPYYHRAVRELIDGPLSKACLERRLSYLRDAFSAEELERLESQIERRVQYLRGLYVDWPLATIELDSPGTHRSGMGTRIHLAADADFEFTLAGIADPAIAFKVRAGGSPTAYNPVSGKWSVRQAAGSLAQGSNPIWIELLGLKDDVVALHSINIEKRAAPRKVAGSVDGKVEWKAENGPVFLQGEVVVEAGAVLWIGPGVDVVCAPGSSLAVRGTLLVEGSLREPVAFRPSDLAKAWTGLHLQRGGGAGSPRHRLAYCRFEGGRPPLLGEGEALGALQSCFLRVEATGVALDQCLFRGISGTAVGAEGSVLEARGVKVADGRNGIWVRGGSVRLEGSELVRLNGDGLRLSAVDSKEGPAVRDTAFRDVLGTGIVVDGGRVDLESVLIHGSHTGMAVRYGARVRATRVTLASNSVGVHLDPARARAAGGAAAAPAKSSFELGDSVLGPHWKPILATASSQPQLKNCVIAPPMGPAEAPRGEGVTAVPPTFIAPERGDFRLADKSSGKGKAAGGADLGYQAGKGKS